MNRQRVAGLAVPGLALALALAPGPALAVLSLDVGSITNVTINTTVGGSVSANLGSAAWSDTTNTGNGWNGSIAATLFNLSGPWTITSGADALSVTTSATYTGSGSTYYKVTVTGCIFVPGGSTVNFSYAGAESGTGSATLSNSAAVTSNVGSHGVTITWAVQLITATSCPYAANDAYMIKVGNLTATTLQLADNQGQATITPQAGTLSPNPTFVNTTGSISGGTPSTFGTPVKFLSAALAQGEGTYTVVPYATFTVEPGAWAATYVGTLQYSIASGP
ncbi:MAG: hypothetical protein ACYDAY_01285 [Candidatus Dormibacteria bacterium]